MPDSHPSALLRQIRSGSTNELGRLLEFYRNYLGLLADSQLDKKVRTRVSPSDIVQETMLEAHRDFHQFRGNSEPEFIGWLRQILVNNLARVIEKHVLAGKRDIRKQVSMDQLNKSVERSTTNFANVFAGREETPSLHAQRRENALILSDLMGELAPQYREVLVLRNLNGLSFQEVAQQMDRSEPATKMLWMRAIKQLRSRFDEKQASC